MSIVRKANLLGPNCEIPMRSAPAESDLSQNLAMLLGRSSRSGAPSCTSTASYSYRLDVTLLQVRQDKSGAEYHAAGQTRKLDKPFL